jgi:hypothetical protein
MECVWMDRLFQPGQDSSKNFTCIQSIMYICQWRFRHTEGSKSNIPCCAAGARNICMTQILRLTFAWHPRIGRKCGVHRPREGYYFWFWIPLYTGALYYGIRTLNSVTTLSKQLSTCLEIEWGTGRWEWIPVHITCHSSVGWNGFDL